MELDWIWIAEKRKEEKGREGKRKVTRNDLIQYVGNGHASGTSLSSVLPRNHGAWVRCRRTRILARGHGHHPAVPWSSPTGSCTASPPDDLQHTVDCNVGAILSRPSIQPSAVACHPSPLLVRCSFVDGLGSGIFADSQPSASARFHDRDPSELLLYSDYDATKCRGARIAFPNPHGRLTR